MITFYFSSMYFEPIWVVVICTIRVIVVLLSQRTFQLQAPDKGPVKSHKQRHLSLLSLTLFCKYLDQSFTELYEVNRFSQFFYQWKGPVSGFNRMFFLYLTEVFKWGADAKEESHLVLQISSRLCHARRFSRAPLCIIRRLMCTWCRDEFLLNARRSLKCFLQRVTLDCWDALFIK